MMGYDLLITDGRGIQIVTLPFYWLARLLAAVAGDDAHSITRGRNDIIWRREQRVKVSSRTKDESDN